MYDDFRNREMSPEQELSEIDQQIHEMRRYRNKLIVEASKKQLDPTIELAVTLAHEAGEMKARYEGQFERNEKQLEKIEKQSSEINTLRSKEIEGAEYKKRAEAAELTLKRSRAARRR